MLLKDELNTFSKKYFVIFEDQECCGSILREYVYEIEYDAPNEKGNIMFCSNAVNAERYVYFDNDDCENYLKFIKEVYDLDNNFKVMIIENTISEIEILDFK